MDTRKLIDGPQKPACCEQARKALKLSTLRTPNKFSESWQTTASPSTKKASSCDNFCPSRMISNWQKSVEEHGFAVILHVLSRENLEVLLNELSRGDLARSRAGVRHAMKLPAVDAIAQHQQLLGMAQSVLGAKAVPFRATLFDKSAIGNWLVVWHQDTALPLRERRKAPGWGPWSVKEGLNYAHAPAGALEEVLALRLHLDDSTAENGPLRVLPGTHNSGVLTDDAIHELSLRVPAVECPVPKGGVLTMRPLIVHASSKSQSANPRRVLHIEYAASKLIGDGLELAIA